MVKKLLFAHQKFFFLAAGIAGSLTGIVLLLGALQLYFDFDRLVNGTGDINRVQYLVINKQVSLVNTLFGGQKGFSKEEIDGLKSREGVLDAAPLTATRFKVGMSMGEGGMAGIPGMYTDMFFEAVPDDFADVPQHKWKWKPGDSLVPVIVPRDYIKLYNFGFAPTQKLPPLTEQMISMAKFDVILSTSKGRIVYDGQIVGFTERINTILVPQSFIDFANKEYAGVEPGQFAPNRVIIRTQGPASVQLTDYMTENGYEASEESLRNSKINSALNLVMTVCVWLGVTIIGLSLLIFLLYSQLVISRSSYEIQTLICIGFSPKNLVQRYMKFYGLLYTALMSTAMACVFVIKMATNAVASSRGFPLNSGLDTEVSLIALTLLASFLIFNYLSVRHNVNKLAGKR